MLAHKQTITCFSNKSKCLFIPHTDKHWWLCTIYTLCKFTPVSSAKKILLKVLKGYFITYKLRRNPPTSAEQFYSILNTDNISLNLTSLLNTPCITTYSGVTCVSSATLYRGAKQWHKLQFTCQLIVPHWLNFTFTMLDCWDPGPGVCDSVSHSLECSTQSSVNPFYSEVVYTPINGQWSLEVANLKVLDLSWLTLHLVVNPCAVWWIYGLI